MDFIKREEREIWEMKDAKGFEYLFNKGNIDFARVEIFGRYPVEGYYRNTKVDEIAYVKSGFGKIVFTDAEYEFKEEDAIFIEKNRFYYFDSTTNAVFLTACNPAWSREQVEQKI